MIYLLGYFGLTYMHAPDWVFMVLWVFLAIEMLTIIHNLTE